MIRFLGNIEAKTDAKGVYLSPSVFGGNCNPLPKKGSCCAKTYSKIAWYSIQKAFGSRRKTN